MINLHILLVTCKQDVWTAHVPCFNKLYTVDRCMVVLDMPGNKYPEGPLGFQANFAHSNHRIFQQLGFQISATKTWKNLNIRCVLFHFEPFEHEAPKVPLPPRCFLWTSWTLLQQVHDMALLTLSSCLVFAQGTGYQPVEIESFSYPKKDALH